MLSILHRPGTALRRHLATRTRGQSLVELALILPIFMLFFAAVLDLGRLAAAEISVSNAAREGAFQAAMTPSDFNQSLPCPADGASNVILCRIKLESSGGVTIASSDVQVTCSWDVTCATKVAGIGNTVAVKVTGHFRLLTPLMGAFLGGQDVSFSSTSVQNVETLPVSGAATPAPTPTPTPTPAPTPTAPGATPTPTPAPTATPVCSVPSAGFTYASVPNSGQAPVTVTVTDTSTSTVCGLTSWFWTWGDGTTSTLQAPGPHTYVASNPGKAYYITLKVGNSGGTYNTTGAVQITVK
jgi:Flp pilus assembly protein TadG